MISYSINAEGKCTYCNHWARMTRQDDGSLKRATTCDYCDEFNADEATIAALREEPQRNQIFMSIDGDYVSVRIHCTSGRRAAELYHSLEKFLVEVDREDRWSNSNTTTC
jgi:hypothetical protein